MMEFNAKYFDLRKIFFSFLTDMNSHEITFWCKLTNNNMYMYERGRGVGEIDSLNDCITSRDIKYISLQDISIYIYNIFNSPRKEISFF